MGDLRKVVPLWHELTVEIKDNVASRKITGWLVDMFSYVFATIILDLPHALRTDWMVSFTGTGQEFDGWTLAVGKSEAAKAQGGGYSDLPRPAAIHYCQPYQMPGGEHKWYKHEYHERGQGDGGILSCDADRANARLESGGFPAAELATLERTAPDFALVMQKSDGNTADAPAFRTHWVIVELLGGVKDGLKAFRERLCTEPMDHF